MTSPKEKVKSVSDFIAQVHKLKGFMMLYRGASNSKWDLEASIYRRIREAIKSDDVSPAVLQYYIGELLRDYKRLGFQRERDGKELSDLELLAELQHNSAATCLIDFTTQPLIALWFACRERRHQKEADGVVFAMQTSDIQRFSICEHEESKKPINEFLGKQKLWKWVPWPNNNRITAQHSVFVFGDTKIDQSYYETITIDKEAKERICKELWEKHGIDELSMFKDLPGFSSANAHDKAYSGSAKHYFIAGISSHQRSDYQEAIKHYSQAIEFDSQYAAAYNNRGVAKHELGNHQGATEDFDRAIEFDSQYAEAYTNRGLAKHALGDHQGAIADHSKAIEIKQNLIEAYNNRGNAKRKLSDYQGAIEDYDQAIRINSQYAEAYNNRGIAKHELDYHQSAIKDYNQAIEFNPNFAEAYDNRGLARHDLSDYQGAIEDYSKAIGTNPQYAEAYSNRGLARHALGDHQGAIEDWNKAVELNPNIAEAYSNRGSAKSELGDHQGAIEDCNQAIKINPQYAEAYSNRGNAKHALGDRQGAEEDWNKAEEINRNLKKN